MPAKQTSRVGAIAATLFTSLVAPTIVSLVTYSIKADHPGQSHQDAAPLPQSAHVWPELPPPAGVRLLPPTPVQPSSAPTKSASRTVTLARPLTWTPAN